VDVTKAGKGWRTLMIVAAQIGVAVALIYSWHYATVVGWMDPFFFSTPQRVGRTLVRIFQTGLVWKHVGATLHATVVGFLLGGSGGVLVGLLLSRSQVALSIANPFVFFFYSLPRIAIAPLFIVLLGLGIKSKIATVIFTVFFIMLINTIAGVRNIQPIWIQSARIMGASPSQISLRIVVPGVLVWIFTGIRVAASFAFASAVVGEFTGATRGVGYQLLLTSTNLDTTGVLAWMTVLGVLALSLSLLVGAIENRVLSWRPDNTGW
jgi:NitT/TauT family transport system permease protein